MRLDGAEGSVHEASWGLSGVDAHVPCGPSRHSPQETPQRPEELWTRGDSSPVVQREGSGVVCASPLARRSLHPRGQHLAAASETEEHGKGHLQPLAGIDGLFSGPGTASGTGTGGAGQ